MCISQLTSTKNNLFSAVFHSVDLSSTIILQYESKLLIFQISSFQFLSGFQNGGAACRIIIIKDNFLSTGNCLLNVQCSGTRITYLNSYHIYGRTVVITRIASFELHNAINMNSCLILLLVLHISNFREGNRSGFSGNCNCFLCLRICNRQNFTIFISFICTVFIQQSKSKGFSCRVFTDYIFLCSQGQ